MPLHPLPVETCRAVARLGRSVERAVAEAELTVPQYRLLAFLATGRSAAAVLAEKLAVSRPTVTAVVDGLVGRGLVFRDDDEADRRRVRVSMTPSGQTALAAADAAVARRLEVLLGLLPDDRAATAAEGLTAVGEALDADRARRYAP